jgi:hypothetical protein
MKTRRGRGKRENREEDASEAAPSCPFEARGYPIAEWTQDR